MIGERIADLATRMPVGVNAPSMTPLSSSTNNILGIGLTSDTLNQTELRSLAEWFIKPQLLSVQGVADAESYGGLIRQIQVQVDPKKMVQFGLNFDDISAAASRATGIRGAGVIDTEHQRIVLHSDAGVPSLDSIGHTPLIRGSGEAMDLSITLGDVATISEGAETPFSGASIMGKEGVLLMVTSQYGANTPEVTKQVERALGDLIPLLKKQQVNVYRDIIRPASFIEVAIANVTESLLIGAVLVSAVLFLFLRNWRGALISALAIPFSLAIAAAVLSKLGYTLNIMTLGGLAIAVGLVVDDAVIDVENMLRRMRGDPAACRKKSLRYQLLLNAGLEVRTPVIFATFAVVLISIPIMTVPGLAGRFFAPLGAAYALATLISLVVALTLTPALSMWFLREPRAQVPALTRMLQKNYVSLLHRLLRRPLWVGGMVAVPLIVCLLGAGSLKTAFIPELHEGHFILHMELPIGTSLTDSITRGDDLTRHLLELPFVRAVVQQTGRTEGGIDIWGTNVSEFNIALKDHLTIDESEVVHRIKKMLKQFPDADYELNTFLTERVEEVISGYTTDAALSIYGNDLTQLAHLADEVSALLKTIPGVQDISQPAEEGAPELAITLNEAALTQWGIEATTVLDAIHTAYQGDVVSQIYEDNRITNIAVILDPALRENLDGIKALPIRAPSGEYVPVGALATIDEQSGRYLVLREGGRRVQTLVFNLDSHDKQAVLAQVKEAVAKQALPNGYYISVASLSDEAVKSRNDLILHSLLACVAIVVLLSLVMRHASQLWLVALNAPLAIMGGMFAVILNAGDLSLGAMVGFITLLGITLRNSVLMLAHYSHVIAHENKPWNFDTIVQASAERLLPILMTAIVTGIGLLPIALNSNEPGREIEGPMAMTILGGLITSTILNLLVMPLLAYRFGRFQTDVD